jgi:surface antigen
MCLRGLASSHPSQRRRWLRFISSLAIVAVALVLRPIGPAAATTGSDDYPPRLKRAAQDALVDPWLFYNRECTSFVAWRLNNDASVAFHNYYLDKHWGDASNWKHAATQAGVTVNETPAVGAVAWWRAGSPGSSRGHVAFVEDISADEITIEEYNYLERGGYDTRTIDASSSVWPSAFIHIGDISIRSQTAPSITGTAQVGSKLKAVRGTWRPVGATFAFQWLANGVPISGATRKTFTPRADQLAQTIQVQVTATKPGLKPATALSPRTAKVKRGVFAVGDAPSVQGAAQVGVQLQASPGTWSPKGAFTYQWYAGGKAVPGATGPTFTPAAAKLGMPIKVRVTATRPGYRTARSMSAPTAAVRPGVFDNATPPKVDGFAQVGKVLSADAGAWTPKGSATYQWLVDGVPVAGATAATYKPVADDVREPISVQVAVARAGYTTATAASAPTDPVAPGSFVNTRDPAITGAPQVGKTLTADPGGWSPKASVAYQWLADGAPVVGADQSTYRPGPDDVGKAITVQVTATRPGYVTALVVTPPSAAVARGVIANDVPPAISGDPIVGSLLAVSPGDWSLAPDSVSYQWRLDGEPISGATSSTFLATAHEGGHNLSVRVTVRAAGYTTTSEIAKRVRILHGTASFARRPVIHGKAVVGKTLTARPGAVTPSRAPLRYRWFRGSHRIHGAVDQTYQLRKRDAGHRIWVQVTIAAPDWATATRRSAHTDVVRPRRR